MRSRLDQIRKLANELLHMSASLTKNNRVLEFRSNINEILDVTLFAENRLDEIDDENKKTN